MSSNVGAIKGKKDLIDVINDNIIPLTAIALIHRIGLKNTRCFRGTTTPIKQMVLSDIILMLSSDISQHIEAAVLLTLNQDYRISFIWLVDVVWQ